MPGASACGPYLTGGLSRLLQSVLHELTSDGEDCAVLPMFDKPLTDPTRAMVVPVSNKPLSDPFVAVGMVPLMILNVISCVSHGGGLSAHCYIVSSHAEDVASNVHQQAFWTGPVQECLTSDISSH